MNVKSIVKVVCLIQTVLSLNQALAIDFYNEGIDYWPEEKKK